MSQLPASGTFSDSAKVGGFQAGLESMRAVVGELPDIAQEAVAPVLSGIAEVPSGFTRLDTATVGTVSVATLLPGGWAPGQTIKIGTVAPSRVVRLVNTGTGDGRILLAGTDTQLDLSALAHLVELKLYLNAGVLEWRELARTGFDSGGSAAAAAASAATAGAAAADALASAGAANISAEQALAHKNGAETFKNAAGDSATAAAGSADAADRSKADALAIANSALLLPMKRLTDADFSGGFRLLASGDLGKTLYVTGLAASRELRLQPGIWRFDTDDRVAWVEVVNKAGFAIPLATVSAGTVRPVVRWNDKFPFTLGATTGGNTTYTCDLPIPALNKGLITVHVGSLWSGLDNAGHDITAAWLTGLSGSLTRQYIYPWTGNAFRLPSYAFTFVPSSPLAAVTARLQLTATTKLNGLLVFAFAIDETDGFHKIDVATSDTEIAQPLPVTSVADFAANELAIITEWKRSNVLPADFSPRSQLAQALNTVTPTQSDPLFVMTGASGWHDRGALNESVTYQGSFNASIKHSAMQVMLVKPRAGGGGASSTLSGITSIPAGKSARIRLEADGTSFYADLSA